MRRNGIFKRPPYSFHFNEGLSPLDLKEQKARYSKLSKADLLDAFADYFRQCEGEQKNIKQVMDDIFHRRGILRQNGLV